MNYKVILTLIILITSLSLNAHINICGISFQILHEINSPITAISGTKFTIKMGVPRMVSLWRLLEGSSELQAKEAKFYRKLRHTLQLLATDPFHPGLRSHKIDSLTEKYGKPIYESYIENHRASAKRVFWTYGPGLKEITILAVENHPDKDKYDKIKLDLDLPLLK